MADINQHARILHNGQYRIEPKRFVVQAPKVFKKTKEQEIDESTRRIEDLREEIQKIEADINDKLDKAEKDAQEIIDKAEEEAERIVSEAEKSAFGRVQKSLSEKDDVLIGTKEEAGNIIDDSKQEATAIINEAKQESNQIRELAHQEGLTAGQSEGFEFAKHEVEHMVDRLHSIISATIDERERILVHSEQQIIKLILTMVKKIVKRLTLEEENVIINNVRESLSLIRGALRVYIHVNPDDYEFTIQNKEALIQMIEGMPEVKFFQNPKIERGGVYIETDVGDIDASIATQLEEVESQMRYYMPIRVKTKSPQDELHQMSAVDSSAYQGSQIIPNTAELRAREAEEKRQREEELKAIEEKRQQEKREAEEARRREDQERLQQREKELEEARLKAEEERRLREEKEREEEERIRRDAEEARRKEEERLKEEQRLREEEEARKKAEEERRIQEEKEAKEAEEARLREEEAEKERQRIEQEKLKMVQEPEIEPAEEEPVSEPVIDLDLHGEETPDNMSFNWESEKNMRSDMEPPLPEDGIIDLTDDTDIPDFSDDMDNSETEKELELDMDEESK